MLTEYYQKNTKRLSKKAPIRYQNLSKEEKTKSPAMLVSDIEIANRQYGRKRYKILKEDEKQRLVDYMKN